VAETDATREGERSEMSRRHSVAKALNMLRVTSSNLDFVDVVAD